MPKTIEETQAEVISIKKTALVSITVSLGMIKSHTNRIASNPDDNVITALQLEEISKELNKLVIALGRM